MHLRFAHQKASILETTHKLIAKTNSSIAKMSGECQGKSSWPELVGAKGEEAAKIIERENPYVKAEIISNEDITLPVVICSRVYVRVDANGIVTNVPIVG